MKNSSIGWTHHTFNPWRGCQKVSPACANCYAETRANRFGEDFAGQRVVLSDAGWKNPVRWNRDHRDLWPCCSDPSCDICNGDGLVEGVRPRVFCASLADVFEDWEGPMLNHKGEQLYWSWMTGPKQWTTAKPIESMSRNRPAVTIADVRRRLFDLIDSTPNLDWLLLTKRPENIRRMMPPNPMHGCETGDCPHDKQSQCDAVTDKAYRHNVWLGTTVENQEQAEKRIPELLKCRELSPVLFLSCEPLLGPLDLEYPETINPPQMCCDGHECGCKGLPCEPPLTYYLDWVIAGGESGTKARPTDTAWYESLRAQCKAANVPFFMKQLSQADQPKTFKDFDAFPESLQVREYPRPDR